MVFSEEPGMEERRARFEARARRRDRELWMEARRRQRHRRRQMRVDAVWSSEAFWIIVGLVVVGVLTWLVA